MIRALGRWGVATALLLAGTTALGAPDSTPFEGRLADARLANGKPADAKPPNGRAEARAQAKAQVKKAQLDYKLARFEQALADYTYAYELYPAPALLFNLGQCHRNLKNYERAIFFFEGYLREAPKIDPDQRALTEDLIAESRAALDRQNAATAAAAARFAAPPMAAPPARQPQTMARLALRSQSGGTTESPTLMGIDRNRPPGSTPVTHRWWFWTAIVGTALAAGAAAYYATGDPRLIAPSGSLGTLDRR
jgi:tetratricopeptide (TPR) repeat protein